MYLIDKTPSEYGNTKRPYVVGVEGLWLLDDFVMHRLKGNLWKMSSERIGFSKTMKLPTFNEIKYGSKTDTQIMDIITEEVHQALAIKIEWLQHMEADLKHDTGVRKAWSR